MAGEKGCGPGTLLLSESARNHGASATSPKAVPPSGLKALCACCSSHFRVIRSSPLAPLLPFTILGLLLSGTCGRDVYPGAAFTCALLGLAPLAERLGYITEVIAGFTNDAIGGLVNATFGNVPELCVALIAVSQGRLRIVQLSLLGSILSNMLFVLGTSFCAGGFFLGNRQKFLHESVQVMSGMLVLAASAIVLPSALSASDTIRDGDSGLFLGRAFSLIMLCNYGAFIFFQLYTHAHIFQQAPDTRDHRAAPHKPTLLPHPRQQYDAEAATYLSDSSPRYRMTHGSMEGGGYSIPCDHRDDAARTGTTASAKSSPEAPEDPTLPQSIVWLALFTILIAKLSVPLVDTIEAAAIQLGLPMPFLSTIALPIVGNAAEHAGAIMFAVKDRLDLSINIALGSSVQIALLVLPVAVLSGSIAKQPLQLNFNDFEIVCLILSVLCVTTCLQRGKSNWLVGLIMVTLYIQVAFAFFHYNDFDLDGVRDQDDACPTQGGSTDEPISYAEGLKGCPQAGTLGRDKGESSDVAPSSLSDCVVAWF
mmetsp:Transcript_7057/g.25981  ORF Transcript_7057/g.25981 Transcript_7057/m.25981 type:complete len:537 (+) Transcript_7057:118-1728(+)